MWNSIAVNVIVVVDVIVVVIAFDVVAFDVVVEAVFPGFDVEIRRSQRLIEFSLSENRRTGNCGHWRRSGRLQSGSGGGCGGSG